MAPVLDDASSAAATRPEGFNPGAFEESHGRQDQAKGSRRRKAR